MKLKIFILIFFFTAVFYIQAQDNDDCMLCHEDEDLTGEINGKEVPVFINPEHWATSIHKGINCVDCHADLKEVELPHEDALKPATCTACHEEIEKQYTESLHGMAVTKNDPLAPKCSDCHTPHQIKPASDPKSPTHNLNIPSLCGSCHREGAEVMVKRDIPQDHIVQNYSLSIHGEGLFKKGLTVTAVCTSCHTAHHVLPHTDERSSISKGKISETCMTCHSNIEQVHRKVIQGELWEKSPSLIPVCVDCHQPHEARKIFYDEGMSDTDCLVCHEKSTMQWNGKTVGVKVDTGLIQHSAHKDVRCAQCHTGAMPDKPRPCETVAGKVDCSICHAEQVENYEEGVHGMLAAKGDENAPQCLDCHGTHEIKKSIDSSSPTSARNIPDLCGKCHQTGEAAAIRNIGPQQNVINNYSMSIHGKGLIKSGLVVTATCVSCHTAHKELPRDHLESTVHKDNITETCGVCHEGIHDQFMESVHSPLVSKSKEELPDCEDCHSAHSITRIDAEGFRLKILNQCGKCHEEITETYFDTYHGKVTKLGSDKTAKCHDCHGSHNILPPDNPMSMLSHQNIVGTCGQCHPGSHRRFAGYLTHATHHDPEKYPFLYYTFWFMTTLLVGTLIVFGLHTLAWLPVSFKMLREKKKLPEDHSKKMYRRFKPLTSKLHLMIIISFFGLAITGMALKFSYANWAVVVSNLLGGFESMGFIHRVCAIITFAYASIHLWSIWKMKKESGKSWIGFIFDKNSLMFNWTDLREAWQTAKWFLGKGPRPHYGRFTYWEKFDYFAVFWGITIIGSSGLMLWFPEFFTLFLPARLINIATVIHSDEALLAVAFIFTIHFFNTHFRPDKFPMDTVMFTGRMTLEELERDKPREYEEFKEAGMPEDRLAHPMPDWYIRYARIFGFCAVAIGLGLVALIIYAMIFAYK